VAALEEERRRLLERLDARPTPTDEPVPGAGAANHLEPRLRELEAMYQAARAETAEVRGALRAAHDRLDAAAADAARARQRAEEAERDRDVLLAQIGDLER
jgi:chromosome segregation ATPase